ncbi:Predicted arabinose efflux permease, MFS family [Rhizobiales bacterium GAS188]|nr:Predicted arabinose efflux permease, MFS family [Rhizobiales bacterium GAS188]
MRALLGGIGDAFEDSNFRRYSVGSVVSWLGFFVQAVAVSWTAWDLTHSTRWLAIVALMDAAPNIVLMPLGGVIADRHDRFRILLISYAFAMLQAAALAGLAFAGQLTIGLLAALAFLHGTIHAFSVPAQFGLLPRFVERRRLSSAIGVSAAYTQLGIFIGPALAGWVILHFGSAIAFATNVVGYGIFFGFVALLRTPAGYEQPTASGKAVMAEFLDGLRAAARHRGIAAILAVMLFGDALAAAVRQMAPAFADTALGAGVEGLSILLAGAGVGATLSALWLAHGGARRAAPSTILWAFLGFLLALVALMLAQSLVAAALAMIALGCFFEICRTGTVALLQVSVPDELRGRVMSTQFLLLRLAGALGVLAVGAAAEDWGLRAPMLCGAALAFLVWGAAFRMRERIASAFSAHCA